MYGLSGDIVIDPVPDSTMDIAEPGKENGLNVLQG